jgi:cobalt/nickel transport system permease protein
MDGLASPARAPLAARDPRLRVLLAVAFAVVVVSLQRPAPAAVALMFAGGLALASGIPTRRLLRRLGALELLVLVILLTLPFSTPGTLLFTLGPLTATREGLATAVLIALRANAVVLAMLGLLGSLSSTALAEGLARLGVPQRLVLMFTLTLRQIGLLDAERRRLARAMRARAFVPRANRHGWRSLGHLVGMLLVRALERAERVQAAMRCRGFDGRLRLLRRSHWHAGDTGLLLAAVPALALLLAWDLAA